MAEPTVLQALGMGARAAGRGAWLAAAGLPVVLARAVLPWLPWIVAMSILRSGAEAASAGGLTAPRAVASAALAALLAPRSIAILAGLWLSGGVLVAALRMAWLAGALPALGQHLSAEPPPAPAFASGVAWGFPRVAGTALLGLAVELAASLLAATFYLGTWLVLTRLPGARLPLLGAPLGAAALALALLVPLGAATLAEAALARAALRDEPPASALASAAWALARRPAAFLAMALALAAAGAITAWSQQAVAAAFTGLVSAARPVLAVGPRLVLFVLAAWVVLLIDLWRLGATAALACADGDTPA